MIKPAVLFRDLFDSIRLISWACYLALTKKRKNLWLISERGTDARDNGYHFFNYIKTHHPEINCKYIISKDSKDYSKLQPYVDDIILFRSTAHFRAVAEASHLISTHIGGCLPDIFLTLLLDKNFNILRHKKIIFLQHGIIKDNLPGLYANQVNLDLFVCGAKPEFDYVTKTFGYKDGIVKYTGLCRYDALKSTQVNTKQILVMPTWRKYIDRNRFIESDYFKTFAKLLTDRSLSNLLDTTGYKLIFYVHHEFQSFVPSFRNLNLSSNIIIADKTYDVQQLLKSSSMLITDYSSVYFDMLYMNKPVIFYQFDQKEFHCNHYEKGYIEENRLGPVALCQKQLLSDLRETINNNCAIQNCYAEYLSQFFIFHDTNNCKRVYQAILDID